MERGPLDSVGYCRGGTLDRAAWPTDGPDEPVRDVLSVPGWARDLATCTALRQMASAALSAEAHPVRSNLFVKSADSNWYVPWHQDRVVCVQKHEDVAGFSGWSVKAGLPHANAPRHVLRKMVAIRLHLDACSAESGPLEVVPGSHDEVLSPEEIASVWSSHRTHCRRPCAGTTGSLRAARSLCHGDPELSAGGLMAADAQFSRHIQRRKGTHRITVVDPERELEEVLAEAAGSGIWRGVCCATRARPPT